MTPEGWQRRSIRELGEVTAGKAKNATSDEPSRPYLRVANVFDGRIDLSDVLEMPFSEEEFARYEIKSGDILLNEGQSLKLVGRCSMYRGEYPGRCAIQNALVRFRAGAGSDPSFFEQLFRWCQGSGVFARIATKTTSIAHLGVNRFADLKVLCPPLPEQRKIAAILSSVDEVIEKTEAVIEHLQVVKMAMMQELLTRGLPGRHTRYKQTEIGEIPAEWEVLRLDETFDILDKHRKPLNKAERSKMQGVIPYYGANGVVDHVDKWLFDQPLVLMAEDGGYFDEYESRHIAYLVDGKSWVNNHAHVLSAKPGFCREWLYYVLVHRDVRPYINSGTRTKLNQADMRRIPMPVPSFDEQEAIATGLATIDSRLAAEVMVVDALGRSKAALVSVLLTGEVRVSQREAAT
ncbi:MAG: restriction endonuclease subunit S [Myxococcota bacterium]